MKRMKTLLALILALLMAAVSACALAELGSGTCGENLTWVLDDAGTLTISGSGRMSEYNTSSNCAPWYELSSSVRSVVLEEGVTSIGSYAFAWCRSLTSVTIPAGVTSIGDAAFLGCSSLTGVTIPAGVTSIGDSAFSDCSSLTEVSIPAGVTSIGSYAFYGCTGLTSVTIPDSVTSIGGCAFYGCSSLTGVTIPAGVTSIGGSAFEGCSSLTGVTIPAGVTSIGSWTFYGCTQAEITLPDGVASVGSNAFDGVKRIICNPHTTTSAALGRDYYAPGAPDFRLYDKDGDTVLEAYTGTGGEVVIPQGVTSISISAFKDCTGLTSVTIPAGVTNIEDYTFCNCTRLTSVTIPDSVTSIGSYAFSGCTGLTAVTIPAGVTSIGSYAFSGCTQAEITLPDGVASIGSYAFDSVKRIICNPHTTTSAALYKASSRYRYCAPGAPDFLFYDNGNQTVLAKYTGEGGEVAIPQGVTSIGGSAFEDCTGLTAVTIPDSVTSIGSYAFSGCSSLTEVSIPAGVTSIGSYAFEGCIGLTAVTIPDSVTSIGSSAFSGCTGLTAVAIPAGVTSIGSSAFSGCSSLTEVTIPAGVTSIKDDTFRNCTGLTSVTIPDSVTSIESYAFSGCTGLTAVTIPAGMTSIGRSAFSGCSSLTGVTIPDSVTSIGTAAFSGCTQAEITLPDGVASIGSSAFDSVKRIICNPKTATSAALYKASSSYRYCAPGAPDCLLCDKEGQTILAKYAGEGGAVVIPQGVTSIGGSAFEDCSSLTGVTIPTGVTSIERRAFYSCSRLTSVTIPDSVTSIADAAFDGCSSLTAVTIPAGVTSIGDGTFRGCSSLTEVTIPAGVTSIDNYTFYDCTQARITLPDGITSIGYGAFIRVNRIICNPQTTTSAALYKASYSYRYCAPGAPDFLFYDNGNQTVLVQYIGEGGAVVIPQGVTSIANSAFKDCTGLTAVTIPDSVTSIGSSAFSGCTGLTSVTIPAGVTSIGDQTFCNCSSLTEVTIPAGVTSIGSSAFSGCTGLTTVTIPAGVTSIGDQTFYYCSNLTAVTIPAGVTSIGGSAFSGCTSLAQVTIPSGVTSISSYAFSGCSSLTGVTIPAGVTSIGSSAFSGCTGLTSVTIPAGVTNIEDYTFRDCTGLTSVTIPSGVTGIGSYAFSGCRQAEITLPDGVTSIGSSAFTSVKRIICNPKTETSAALGVAFFPPDAPDFKLSESEGVVSVKAFSGSKENVLMPKHAMRWSTSTAFASLRLPATLDADCSISLTATNVTVPDGVTNLGTLSLTNVQRLYLPDSVQNLDGLTLSGTKPVVYCSAGSTAQAWAMFGGYETRTDGWGDECTLRYPGALALDVGESMVLRRTDFVISPIPADYRGEITLESADLAVDGMTVTALEPGDATVTATLDDRYSVRIPVHVYQPAERIVLKAPSICLEGQSFTVMVEELAPEDVSGKLTWTQDGVQVYEGTGLSRTLTAPEGQTVTIIRVTAPGGVSSEATVRLPKTVSAPYLRSSTAELGSLVGICVDVDGETLADDPLTYGTVELGASTSALTLEDGVVRATGMGTVTFRVKGMSGSWVYFTVTVQDTLHAYRTQVPAKAPNCVGPGNAAYEICVGCGRFFNAAGEEITEGSWVLPATHVHHLAGGSACRDCGQTFSMTGLNVMTLPSALRVIRNEAFAGATAQTIVVPVGCESVGERAFAGCAALRSIFLPAALEESLPESAFEGCDPELEIIFR